MNRIYTKFDELTEDINKSFVFNGALEKVQKWQGLEVKNTAFGDTIELLNYYFQYNIPTSNIKKLQEAILPNMPWAEDHFLERVCGKPLNPGNEYKNWPFYKRPERDSKFREKDEKFSHTYMERYWTPDFKGTRFKAGNLGDIVNQLHKEPTTRQAYLPMWFPEDTGVKHGGRVPCSLGYHFILRKNWLHISYYLRSCDYVRHFRDDVYLTIRLVIWLIEQLRKKDPFWKNVSPGLLSMHIVSFHMFENDYNFMFRK
jgi:thymidylate synthase